jgi:uncharacterized protein (UPF0218 family)
MYRLPDQHRDEFREVLGEIVPEESLKEHLPYEALIISVGDMVSYTLHKLNYRPHLTIIDFHTQRDGKIPFEKELKEMGEHVVSVRNPAGEITRELWEAIKEALASDRSVRIEVEGEEDLATIPCVMLAPNDSYLVYGLWNRGLVLVEVNPKTRKRVENALKLMEV